MTPLRLAYSAGYAGQALQLLKTNYGFKHVLVICPHLCLFVNRFVYELPI